MRIAIFTAAMLLGGSALAPEASAVVCGAGPYRAGCAGPNGAVVARRPYPHYGRGVTCARGVYRAGCAGPNGAVIRRY
jgi:hypothetical protein